MEMTQLELEPTSVPEWDAEDELSSVLIGETLVKADNKQSKENLNKMRLELPKVIDQVKLLQYAKERQTPLALAIPPDSKNYDFYLIEIPLNILVIDRRLVRLRLTLNILTAGQNSEPAVAYDLFPNDQSDLKTIMTGGATLDVSKALRYILAATGTGEAAAPIAECFGLKLDLPFKWTSEQALVQTSDRLSNPVDWYVTDGSIQNGFTAHAIIRAPKGCQVSVDSMLECEIRRTGLLGKILKAQYKSHPHTYSLKE